VTRSRAALLIPFVMLGRLSRIRVLPIIVHVTMNTTLKIVAVVSVLAQAAAAAALLFPQRQAS
jgi:hypothetical protein